MEWKAQNRALIQEEMGGTAGVKFGRWMSGQMAGLIYLEE